MRAHAIGLVLITFTGCTQQGTTANDSSNDSGRDPVVSDGSGGSGGRDGGSSDGRDAGGSGGRDAGGSGGWDGGGSGGRTTGSGGRVGSGGAPGSGGFSASGGTIGSGGSSASGGATGSGGAVTSGGAWQDPPVTTVAFTAVNDIFPNPERGFYRVISLERDRNFSSIRSAGYSLIYGDVDLSGYRTRDLDSAFLTAFEGGLTAARQAGVKVVFRFLYNEGPWPNSEPDASEYWIMRHLASAKPVLQRNADVIAVMQAGLIGAWGEWHSSTNGLLDDSATKFRIIQALLDVLPASRDTQIRTPGYKIEGYGKTPLADATAFDGSYRSRIGHHNDCFLTDSTDYGTYGSNVEGEKDYISQEGLYVPVGGETCGVYAPRSECPNALSEMKRLRWSFINNDYHPDVIASWSSGGCRPEIERRLGYRFTLVTADVAQNVRPGGVLPVTIQMKNDGWAPPYNARPVKVVLNGPVRLVAELPGVDVRRFKPGTTVSFGARMQLPRSMPAGSYTLSLWMPDAASTIQDDARYAIRLGNASVWDATTGTNRLGTVVVSDSAPGSVDTSATTFVAR